MIKKILNKFLLSNNKQVKYDTNCLIGKYLHRGNE